MTDDDLVAGFEAGTLEQFRHADHVRLTVVYLSRHGRDETLRLMMDGLRRFATMKGHPEKFHVTMTRAWVDLIDAACRAHPEVHGAGPLVAACPELLDANLLDRFYSRDRLHADAARLQWVPPDLRSPIGLDESRSTGPADPAA